MDQFSKILLDGLSWLASLSDIAAGFAAVGFSGLLLAIFVDKKSYGLIADWMGERNRSIYRRVIASADAGLNRFFGPRLLGWQALDRCLFMAFIYPACLLLISWALGFAPTLGGVALFNADLVSWQRAGTVTGLFVVATGAWYFFRKRKRIALALMRILPPRLQQNSILASATEFVIFASLFGVFSVLTFAFAIAVAGAGAGAVAVVVAFAIAGAGAGAGAIAGAGIAAVVAAVVAAVTIALVLAVVGAGAGAAVAATAGATIALYIILPISNAALDWLSWAVSRRLLAHLIERGANATVATVLMHALLDLLAAILLLVGLAVLMPLTVQAVNTILIWADWQEIEWWDYLAAARRQTLAESLFVTGMLLSTLLPTAAHFLVLLFVLIFPRPVWMRERWLDGLTTPNPALILKIIVVGWFALSALASTILLFVLGTVLYAGLSVFGPEFGDVLVRVALWAGELVGPPQAGGYGGALAQ